MEVCEPFLPRREGRGLSRWSHKQVTPASGGLSWGARGFEEILLFLENGHVAFHFSYLKIRKHMFSVFSHVFSCNSISKSVLNSILSYDQGNNKK